MDPISLAVGLVALAPPLIQACRSLRRSIKDFKYAQEEIKNLSKELDMFTEILDSFGYSVRKYTGEALRAGAVDKLIRWTSGVFRGLRKLRRKIKGLKSDSSYSLGAQVVGTFKAYVKWHFEKRSVKCLQASLSVARETMSFFLSVICLETLQQELDELKTGNNVGIPQEQVDQFLGSLERRVQTQLRIGRRTKSQVTRAQELLSELQESGPVENFVPQTTQLDEFTDQVIRYADDVFESIPTEPGTRYEGHRGPPRISPSHRGDAQGAVRMPFGPRVDRVHPPEPKRNRTYSSFPNTHTTYTETNSKRHTGFNLVPSSISKYEEDEYSPSSGLLSSWTQSNLSSPPSTSGGKSQMTRGTDRGLFMNDPDGDILADPKRVTRNSMNIQSSSQVTSRSSSTQNSASAVHQGASKQIPLTANPPSTQITTQRKKRTSSSTAQRTKIQPSNHRNGPQIAKDNANSASPSEEIPPQVRHHQSHASKHSPSSSSSSKHITPSSKEPQKPSKEPQNPDGETGSPTTDPQPHLDPNSNPTKSSNNDNPGIDTSPELQNPPTETQTQTQTQSPWRPLFGISGDVPPALRKRRREREAGDTDSG